MVSFFGFKIGGEKKKKSTNEVDVSPNQLHRKHSHDPMAERRFLSKETGKNGPYGGNVYSVSRPDTSHSYKITATRMKASPYSSSTGNAAAMSMSELSQPNLPGLKQHASNPNLGKGWYNPSASDLVPPVPMRNPSRPGTPVKQQPNWISPLDMNAVDGPSVPAAAAPKSPLGQYEHKLDFPNQPAPLFGENDDISKAPAPLRIRKPSPAPQPSESLKRSQSPKKPPSPPQSIKDTGSPVQGRPAFPRDDMFRPSSRGSNRNMSTTLKEVQNAWDVPDYGYYGPASIPSPISTPRGSEEEASSGITNMWGEPVIQMVRARRDTLTSIAPRRRSLEMKVEEFERPRMDDTIQRPKTSGGPQTRRLARPPPLNLNSRPRTPDRAGTYPPVRSPLSMDVAPHTPTGERSSSDSRRPLPRDRTGPPPAAIGAHGRPGRPNTRNVRRPAADEYTIQPQTHSRRASGDSSIYDRPPSPDSPLMPLTGPLASISARSSPRFPPSESQPDLALAPPPPLKNRLPQPEFTFPNYGSTSNFTEDETAAALAEEDLRQQLAAPRLGHRNVPTPDSSDWPLPSPTASSFDQTSVSYAASYAEEVDFDVPLQTPPRVLPQGVTGVGVGGRAESPFGFRSFNFSRPMTPTLDQPPLRRDFTTHFDSNSGGLIGGAGGEARGRGNGIGVGGMGAVPLPPKRSETVPVSPKHRDVESSPSSGRILPPRANTVTSHTHTHNMGRGLRSPAIVGDDFGGGFI
ncbi:hypothetical protein GGS26DRAFT_533179 [Hypomontagnella submonticulosa]|nr:hypothetical protein GGS26DRAFT_533179 [Hypomontagnella submonticulosa]